MAKTKEELQQLKQEYESLNNKLKELNEDELKLVTGSGYQNTDIDTRKDLYENIILGASSEESKKTCTSWHTHNGVDIEG